MSIPIKIIGFDFLIHSTYDTNSHTCIYCGKNLYLPDESNKSEIIIDEHKDGFHKSCEVKKDVKKVD
jgi:hypothetical protein